MHESSKYITKYVDAIKKKALFLEENGFKVKNANEYTITYSRGDICSIDIYYGRYSDADVYIRFKNYGLPKPEQYSLGWFRNMKMLEMSASDTFSKPSNSVDKLAVIFSLLEYLQITLAMLLTLSFVERHRLK